jgi:hypothetical protein
MERGWRALGGGLLLTVVAGPRDDGAEGQSERGGDRDRAAPQEMVWRVGSAT